MGKFVTVVCLLALPALVHASLIERPLKTCGTRTYAEEVPLGCETILNAEVDGDFDTLFGDYNGNITNANIATNANIDCDKIADGTCGTGQIGSGAVCVDEIGASCVGSAEIINDTILNEDIFSGAAIAGSKLAVGAAVRQLVVGACVPGVVAGATETGVATVATITTTGGTVLLQPNCGFSYRFSTGTGLVRWRWKRGATTLATIDQPVISSGAALALVTLPTTAPHWIDQPAAGTYIYILTAEVTDGAVISGATNEGDLLALELR